MMVMVVVMMGTWKYWLVSPQKRMMKRPQMVRPWTLSQTGMGLSWQLETLRTPKTSMTMPRTKQPKRKMKTEQ